MFIFVCLTCEKNPICIWHIFAIPMENRVVAVIGLPFTYTMNPELLISFHFHKSSPVKRIIILEMRQLLPSAPLANMMGFISFDYII